LESRKELKALLPKLKKALQVGLVDVKLCAVDDNCSGLKLVYRLKDRAKV
jgi:hypothetical protein